jgi:3-hydroxyisobutyrate dehydrogenase-like beta-hydroxyacid dehydrogenase
VITSLPNSAIVREAVLGKNGIAEGAEEGLVICDTSTSRPDDSERLAKELAERGIKFLDSAVSGTSAMAVTGDLIVIAGGDKAVFEACRPVFAGFSRAAYHMGPVGSGARTKLVINLILSGNRFALAEGLVLGEKMGLGMDNLLEVVKDGASSSKTMIDKGPKMLKADYSKQGQIKTALKDNRLMIEESQRLGAPLFLTGLYSQILQAAYEKGYGEKDSVATFEILRGMAGLEERVGIDDEPFGKP